MESYQGMYFEIILYLQPCDVDTSYNEIYDANSESVDARCPAQQRCFSWSSLAVIRAFLELAVWRRIRIPAGSQQVLE